VRFACGKCRFTWRRQGGDVIEVKYTKGSNSDMKKRVCSNCDNGHCYLYQVEFENDAKRENDEWFKCAYCNTRWEEKGDKVINVHIGKKIKMLKGVMVLCEDGSIAMKSLPSDDN
jgi:hypothetical protein